jgi:hypothetical protein
MKPLINSIEEHFHLYHNLCQYKLFHKGFIWTYNTSSYSFSTWTNSHQYFFVWETKMLFDLSMCTCILLTFVVGLKDILWFISNGNSRCWFILLFLSFFFCFFCGFFLLLLFLRLVLFLSTLLLKLLFAFSLSLFFVAGVSFENIHSLNYYLHTSF